jgi:hypothetical protein
MYPESGKFRESGILLYNRVEVCSTPESLSSQSVCLYLTMANATIMLSYKFNYKIKKITDNRRNCYIYNKTKKNLRN